MRRSLSRGHPESFDRSARTYPGAYPNQLREQTMKYHARPPFASSQIRWRTNRGIQSSEHCSRCPYNTHLTRSTRSLVLAQVVKSQASRVKRPRRGGEETAAAQRVCRRFHSNQNKGKTRRIIVHFDILFLPFAIAALGELRRNGPPPASTGGGSKQSCVVRCLPPGRRWLIHTYS